MIQLETSQFVFWKMTLNSTVLLAMALVMGLTLVATPMKTRNSPRGFIICK